MTKREYEVRFAQTLPNDPEHMGKLEVNACRWLDERGAEGYRLIRAEADAQGVMWLIMERTIEEEKQ